VLTEPNPPFAIRAGLIMRLLFYIFAPISCTPAHLPLQLYLFITQVAGIHDMFSE
ncbi:hypothetical protein M9458_035148, partial [Cirrhinus mrigala]